MWKMIFNLLTESLGLPLEKKWDYIILAIIGIIAYIVAFRVVGKMYDRGLIFGRDSGSFFHWLIRLVVFFLTWAIVCGIITAIHWICDNWIFVLSITGSILLLSLVVFMVIRYRKQNRGEAK